MKSGIYNITGGSLRAAISLASFPLLIRLLGANEYGVWALVSAVIGVMAVVEGGLSMSTTVFASRELRKGDLDALAQTIAVTFGLMLVVATAAAVALCLFADTFASFFTKLQVSQRESAAYALRIGGIVLWTRLLQQLFIGIEQAYDRYGLTNLIATAQTLFATVGMIWLAWKGEGTVSLMKWQAVINTIFFLVHAVAIYVLLRGKRLRIKWNRQKTTEIIHASVLTWTSLLGSVLFSQCDRLIVGALGGASILGAYAAITGVAVQINILSALPVQPLLSAMSRNTKEILEEDFRPLMRRALHMNAFVALGLGGALIALAPMVVHILLKSTDSDYIWCFQYATVIYAIYSMNAVGYHVLLGIGALKDFALIQLVSGLFSLLLIAIGVFTFGLKGAILGNIGYWGVWLLTVRAMAKIRISFRFWAGTLTFYWAWFFAAWAIDIVLAEQIILKVIAFLVELAVICIWFFIKAKSLFISQEESHG